MKSCRADAGSPGHELGKVPATEGGRGVRDRHWGVETLEHLTLPTQQHPKERVRCSLIIVQQCHLSHETHAFNWTFTTLCLGLYVIFKFVSVFIDVEEL